MISFGFALQRLLKGFIRGVREPEFRALLFVLFVTLLGGTLFFRAFEGWSLTDSFYFAVMTLATISPEGFALTSVVAKMFAVVYVIGGLGVLVSFALLLAGYISGTARPRARTTTDLEKTGTIGFDADNRKP
jgi:hypothetical protein